jgi:hypothetical protein
MKIKSQARFLKAHREFDSELHPSLDMGELPF